MLTSSTSGNLRILRSTIGPHWTRSSRLSPCNVNWYCELLHAPADAQILRRLQKQGAAGNLGQLAAQPADDLVGAEVAFFEWLERDKHAAGVGRSPLPSGERHDTVDGRVLAHGLGKTSQQVLHRPIGHILVRLDRTDDAAGILLREKSLGDDDVQIDRKGERQQRHQQCDPLMPEDPAQRRLVPGKNQVKDPFADAVHQPSCFLSRAFQQHCAHHRRGGQRYQHRHGDGHGQGDGKLAKEPADNSAHQQDGNEYRDQGDADRQHGEADFLGSFQRGLERRMPFSRWRLIFSITTIASSTTKPVATVSAMSDKLSRLYPNRYMTPKVPTNETGTAMLGMNVAPEIAQEQEHDQDHQRDGNDERELHVGDRSPDRGRTIHADL